MKVLHKFTSIKSKLAIIAISATLFLIFVGYLSNTYINRIEKISKLSLPLNQFIIGTQTIRTYEKDFLLFDVQSELFFVSGNSMNIDKFNEQFIYYQALIEGASINIAAEISDSTLRLRLNAIEQNFRRYKAFFHAMEKNIRARGSSDYGMIGKWITLESAIQNTLKNIEDYTIHDEFETISRYRSQYLQYKNPIYLSEIKNELKVVNSYLEQIEHHDDDILKLKDQLGVYTAFGDKLFELDKTIGYVGENGLLQDIQLINEDIERETNHSLVNVENYIKKQNNIAKRKLSTIIFIIAILTLIALSYMSKTILRPIRLIEGYIKKLAKGKFPKKIHISSKDEIKDMLDALNGFVDSLKAKTMFATEIGKSKFDSKFHALSKKDMLGNALIDMQKRLAKASETQIQLRAEEEKRTWTSTGMTSLSDILRENNNNPAELAKAAIEALVKYLDGNLGAVFLINDTDTDNIFLEQTSTFAYDRMRNEQKKVAINEGLIGRCINEKKILYMTDVPSNYITITSGLGEDIPRMLVIAPLICEDSVLGVIEIAGLYKLEQYKIDFLLKFSENFASTIASVRVNERTNILLEQTRQQTEEMAAQEEEMRQNLEELQATQEEAARKEAEINGLLTSLDTSTYLVEYDTKGKILKVNPVVCRITGRKPDQLIGTYHSDYVDFEYEDKNEYEQFWKDLLRGKIIQRISRKLVNDSYFWLQETYSPIMDINDEVERILNIAFDITEIKELEIQLKTEKDKSIEKEKELLIAVEKTVEQNRSNEKNLNELSKLKEELEEKSFSLSANLNAIDNNFLRIEYTVEGIIKEINQNILNKTGYKKEDLIGKPATIFVRKEDVEDFKKSWQSVLEGNIYHSVDIRQANGKYYKISYSYTPVFDANNKILNIIYLGVELPSE